MSTSMHSGPTWYGRTGIYIALGQPTGQITSYYGTTGKGITPQMAEQLDFKIDDGLPTMGNVIANSWGSTPYANCGSIFLNGIYMNTTAPSPTITYSRTETIKSCGLSYRTGLE